MPYKRILKIGIVFIVIYLVILPIFWPSPTAIAKMPDEAPHNQNLQAKIRIDSWHRNYQIVQVRFYVDYYKTTAHGSTGALPTTLIYQGKSRNEWGFWNINRFTWPRKQIITADVPLDKLSEQGLVRPGTAVGKIDVTLEYVPSASRTYRVFGGGFRALSATESTSFKMELR